MPEYRVVLQRRAFEQLRRLPAAERNEALRILEALRLDPLSDASHKRVMRIPPDVLVTVYDGQLVFVSYHLIDFEVVSVLAIVAWGRHRPDVEAPG